MRFKFELTGEREMSCKCDCKKTFEIVCDINARLIEMKIDKQNARAKELFNNLETAIQSKDQRKIDDIKCFIDFNARNIAELEKERDKYKYPYLL